MRWLVVSVLVVTLILIPFFLFESYFNELAAKVIAGDASRRMAALAIGAFLASDVVLPIPSSLVSTAAGVLLGFWSGAAVIWSGMMVSCLVGYGLGAGSAERARRFVGEAGLRRAEAVGARYGDLAIVLCRPVPVLAEASVIFSGLMGAPFGRFLSICAWSNLGVAVSYAAIGALSMSVDSLPLALIGGMVLPGLAALGARIWLGATRPD